MEFADGGDLMKKVENASRARLPLKETEIWSIIIQMIQGLKTLHDLKICHRDLKVSIYLFIFSVQTYF